MLVDLHEDDRDKPPELVVEDFYGELLRVIRFQLPSTPSLEGLEEPLELVYAFIHKCNTNLSNDLGQRFYRKMAYCEAVDLNCLKCLVGRMKVGKNWVVIDRSGAVQATFHVDAATGDGNQ